MIFNRHDSTKESYPVPRRMKASRKLLPLTALAASLIWGGYGARGAGPVVEAKTFATAVRPLFDKHCADCHGADEQKGGMRLDELLPKFDAPDSAARWLKVMERIVAGEMPPEDEERPPADAVKQVAGWIDANLFAADTERRAREGRSRVRRLNRVEHEYTLHDLFGIDAPLKDLLPEDGMALGFDKVGTALDLSSVLMERYLQAADAAIDAALAHEVQPPSLHERFTYEGDGINAKIMRDVGAGPQFARVFFLSNENPPTHLRKFKAPVAGHYRFRVGAYAFQSEQPVTYRIYTCELFRRDAESKLIGHFRAPPMANGEYPALEFDVRLNAGQTIKFMPYDLGYDIYRIGAEKYPGAGLAVQWVEVDGPVHDARSSKNGTGLFGNLAVETETVRSGSGSRKGRAPTTRYVVASKNPPADAERIVREFVPRAFRRPATEEEIAPFVQLAHQRLAAGYEFEKAVRVAFKAVLCAPEFLLLDERPGRLSDDAVASRLSYFLWNSCPDDELLRLAAAKKLRTPENLRAQVERMLQDPKAARFTKNFTGQWLNLREIDATLPDKTLYPEFDEYLMASMLGETETFFDDVLRNNRSVMTFVDSDFTFLNERLAKHYGIAGVDGPEFRRVSLAPGSHRGGVLGQAAVLKVTANGTTTSPVLRGKFVADKILGEPTPGPPTGVPAVEPDIRGAVTIREQLAKHREIGQCASCHVKIDPLGFALENYDVIGGWRGYYRSLGEGARVEVRNRNQGVRYKRGRDVDAADVLPDGRKFHDVDEFKRLIAADPDRIARCLAEKLIVYGTGSGISYADRRAVKEIVESARGSNFGLRDLLHAVVQSPVFLNK